MEGVYIGVSVFSLVFILSLLEGINRITIKVDTIKSIYLVKFMGGNISFKSKKGNWGVEYDIAWKKGFIAFKDMFKTEPADQKPDKKKAQPEIPQDKKQKKEDKKDLISILKEEIPLAKKVINNTLKLIKEMVKTAKILYLDGTFYVKDPFYLGIYYAIFAPFSSPTFSLLPNYHEENYLRTEVHITPGKIFFNFLKFMFTMPVFDFYKLYRKLAERG